MGNNFYTFKLKKENIIYEIIIKKYEIPYITIETKNYSKKLDQNELFKKTGRKFKTLDSAYEFIINLFKKNLVLINEIIEYDSIILEFEFNKYKKFEISLTSNFKEVKNLSMSNLINDSYINIRLDNTFSIFKSINNLLYLIYSNRNKSIICYDLIKFQKINEIKNAHSEYITNFRHYFDKQNKRDLVMSISAINNNLKIWNAKNWDCILNINKVNNKGLLYSACFLNYKKYIYIITSNFNKKNAEPIKIFDLNGQKIEEINSFDNITLFIDVYYNDILNKQYIITGNKGYSKSYIYNTKELYHIYSDCRAYLCDHYSVIINNNGQIRRLIDSCSYYEYIRIWGFNSGLLLNKIKINDYYGTFGICLWNNNYIFTVSKNGIHFIFNENNNSYLNKSWLKSFTTIKKFIHPQFGECLICQEYLEEKIII